MRARLVLTLILAGCGGAALPNGSDGGGAPGDATPTSIHVDLAGDQPAPNPDLAAASCNQLESAISTWIADHQSCTSNADCAQIQGICCPVTANNSALTPSYTTLLMDRNDACGPVKCNCPIEPAQVGCNQGVCGPLTTPLPPGPTCQSAADCHGPLPSICQLCSDGTTQCAHFTCADDLCTVTICP